MIALQSNSISTSAKLIATLGILSAAILMIGCGEPRTASKQPPAKKQNEADSGSIINKTTQDIGEFDAKGEAKEADLQVKTSANPLASMGAYGYAVGEISKQSIQRAVQLFQAEHGRFPKDHEEFMSQIIKKNNIQLPVLPGKRRYQYDVENHELKVVEAEN